MSSAALKWAIRSNAILTPLWEGVTFEGNTVFFNLLSLDVAATLSGGREWTRKGLKRGGRMRDRNIESSN